MVTFPPQPLKKWNFLDFFVKVTPPPPTPHPPTQEESKCKNAQFLQWILKDDDGYFQKIKES